MFAGFNREVRNSLRVMGLRIRYAVAVVEIAAEQYGAVVANNIDLLLTSRGTGVVRTAGNLRVGTGGQIQFEDANGYIFRNTSTNIMQFAPSSATAQMALSAVLLSVFVPVRVGSQNAAVTTQIFGAVDRSNNAGAGHPVRLVGGAGSTATTGSVGGRAEVIGGAANGTGNNVGGDVLLSGGAPTGTGARGVVQLGYDGSNVCRVTVRNTILGLNGYTSSAADPTTTDLATAGDYGIHKNTTSGTVYLAFNDGGTIKKVALV